MDIMIRVVDDSRFVLSHDEIIVHITHDKPDILRAWLKILTLAQGMNTHNRMTTTATTEDEYDNISTTFLLGHLLGNVHNLLVLSAFEAKEKKNAAPCWPDSEGLADNDGYRHSKVGRTSQESSACSTSTWIDGLDCASKYSDVKLDTDNFPSIPSYAVWLIFECLKSIDGWLCHARNNFHSIDDTNNSCLNSFRKKVFRLGKGTNSSKVCKTSLSWKGKHGHQLLASSEHLERFDLMDTDMCTDDTSSSRPSDDIVEIDAYPELEAFGLLNMIDWPNIVYDVSKQDISFHIPLHCLLSLLLRKAVEKGHGEMEKLEKTRSGFSACGYDFFGQVLSGVEPCGFSAFLMEHPLQLRVFCAQVRAGLWRRSGDTAIWMTEFYRVGQWLVHNLKWRDRKLYFGLLNFNVSLVFIQDYSRIRIRSFLASMLCCFSSSGTIC